MYGFHWHAKNRSAKKFADYASKLAHLFAKVCWKYVNVYEFVRLGGPLLQPLNPHCFGNPSFKLASTAQDGGGELQDNNME